MDDIQNQMSAILENPEMMQKIMSMAQALNQSSPAPESPPPQKTEHPAFSMPDIDISMLQRLSSLAGKSNIDSNQQTLLKALGPYLSRDRISKLERAMRAAKMASLASAFLGSSGLQFIPGR